MTHVFTSRYIPHGIGQNHQHPETDALIRKNKPLPTGSPSSYRHHYGIMVVGNVLPMHPAWWFLFTWEPKYTTGFLIKKKNKHWALPTFCRFWWYQWYPQHVLKTPHTAKPRYAPPTEAKKRPLWHGALEIHLGKTRRMTTFEITIYYRYIIVKSNWIYWNWYHSWGHHLKHWFLF